MSAFALRPSMIVTTTLSPAIAADAYAVSIDAPARSAIIRNRRDSFTLPRSGAPAPLVPHPRCIDGDPSRATLMQGSARVDSPCRARAGAGRTHASRMGETTQPDALD